VKIQINVDASNSESSKCSVETNLLSEEAVKALEKEAAKTQEKAEKDAHCSSL
jgi:hypothetical protein